MLHFINMLVGQAMLENNLPKAISASYKQALISNPALVDVQAMPVNCHAQTPYQIAIQCHWTNFLPGTKILIQR